MFQGFPLEDRRGSGPFSLKTVAIVCLVLLAVLAVVQVVHLHANVNDADHCPLCILMHSAAPVSLAAILIVLVQMERAGVAAEPRPVMRSWFPRHFTRPPPAGF